MISIKTWRNPYDTGVNLTKSPEIELNPGLTVLVGCNGAGKTTLLHNISDECKKQNIPFHFYNNLTDGGNSLLGEFLSNGDENSLSFGASIFTASEGEGIKLNLSAQASKYKEFYRTGYFKNKSYQFHNLFRKTPLPEICEDNRRVLLFDATDSGLSIDSVCEIKEFFSLILQESKDFGVELYIFISANEYELCRNERCLDVTSGKECSFKDYEEYRKYILNNRKMKDRRIEKEVAYKQKQKEKAHAQFQRKKIQYEKKISNINDRAKSKNRDLTYSEKWEIERMERELLDEERNLE